MQREDDGEICRSDWFMHLQSATVPKVNVVIGKAYGTAYVAMNSKAVGADMVYAWENAEIGMMDADLAAKIMYAGDDAAALTEKAAEYRELQNSVSLCSSKRIC
ncbi:MAG: carboxyl transferase domain-containing protein [Ruminococcus sp.]